MKHLWMMLCAFGLATSALADERIVPWLERLADLKQLQIKTQQRFDVEYQGVALSDAIKDLRERSGLNIYIAWPELKRAGISQQTPITYRGDLLTIEEVMRGLCLKATAPGTDWADVPMAEMVDEIYVLASRATHLNRTVRASVYPVKDILLLTDADPERPGHITQESTNLANMVRTYTGDPERWARQIASCNTLNGSLFVKADAAHHREIAELLTSLRASLELPAPERVTLFDAR